MVNPTSRPRGRFESICASIRYSTRLAASGIAVMVVFMGFRWRILVLVLAFSRATFGGAGGARLSGLTGSMSGDPIILTCLVNRFSHVISCNWPCFGLPGRGLSCTWPCYFLQVATLFLATGHVIACNWPLYFLQLAMFHFYIF